MLLQKNDWKSSEDQYVLVKGHPQIHPSILFGVLLYGLLKRVRTSRALEESLQVRMDFRWLAEGRSIDHSTIAKFRTAHPESLKEVFGAAEKAAAADLETRGKEPANSIQTHH